ncbi:MAG: DUF5723 family protein [Bacteroidota bacterium]
MKRYIFLIIAMFTFSFVSLGQDRMLAHMNTVPQSLDANPAATLPYKFYFGFPALNSFYFGFQNPFAFNDIVKRRADDSLWVDQKGFIDGLSSNRNLMFMENRVDVFNFGFRLKKNFFTFSNSIRSAVYFSYPKDMMSLLVNGNVQFLSTDQTVDMSKLRINGSVWSEIAVGFQRHLTNRINIGGRVKMLHGFANISNPKTDISFYTDPNSYAWTLISNAEVNMASIIGSDGKVSTSDLMKNKGFSLDLGGTYRFNDKLSVGLSVLDFGYISWKTNTNKYTTNMKEDNWVFKGLELSRLFIDGKINTGIMQEIGDTIKEQFQFNDSIKENYSTWMYPKLCANAYYKLGDNNKFGFYSRNDIANGTIFPSFTFSYNRKFGRVLELGVSYSMIHKNWANLGAGLALKLGPVQTYITTENILSFFNVASAKNAYIHFGFNFVIGKWVETLLDQNKTSIDI